MSDEYDDNDKPSWREIDRRKDQSKHTSSEPSEPRQKSARKEWAQKMYLKEIYVGFYELQNLFHCNVFQKQLPHLLHQAEE